MSTITLYHATHKKNVSKIRSDGFWVRSEGSVNIYGRGVYFWQRDSDAHAYGRHRFGASVYGVVDAELSFSRTHVVKWNPIYRNQDPDTIAKNLLRKGVGLIWIPNHLIEDTTFSFARGDAYCWLADIST